MFLEHERYHGLGMDAVLGYRGSWNTNVIVVWAWTLEYSFSKSSSGSLQFPGSPRIYFPVEVVFFLLFFHSLAFSSLASLRSKSAW